MRSRVVCDASAIVAILLDNGSDGRWATDAITGMDLVAPSLLPFEAANILRRHELAKLITADQATQAHADLLELTIEHWPYELLTPRAWQLRSNLTMYDASYVALAELLDVALVTLDRRIGRVPQLRCPVVTP